MLAKTRLISDKELYDYIVSLIKKATSDIGISSPWIYNCDHILDELVAAGGRGVKISVVMRQPNNDLSDKNYKNYQDKLNAIGKLKEAKADIIFDPYVHEKVVISDGKEMIVSSANLIGTSLTRNGESGTHTNDPQEIEKYQLRLAKKYSKKPVQQRQNIANIIRKPAIGSGVGGTFGLSFKLFDPVVVHLVQGQFDNRERYRVISGIQVIFGSTLQEWQRGHISTPIGGGTGGVKSSKRVQGVIAFGGGGL